MDLKKSDALYNTKTLRNSLIEKEIEYEKNYGTSMFPAVVINNQTFRGQLERESVFNAICSGFKDTPKYCKKYIEHDLNQEELIFMEEDGYHDKGTVALICSLIMLSVLLILCCYRRYAKRQMKEQMHI